MLTPEELKAVGYRETRPGMWWHLENAVSVSFRTDGTPSVWIDGANGTDTVSASGVKTLADLKELIRLLGDTLHGEQGSEVEVPK